MPSIYDIWPSKWLKAHDLGDRTARVYIETVVLETLRNPRTNREEPKLIVAFAGKQKRLILNKTQAQAIAAITGSDDYTAWPGHACLLSAGVAPNNMPTIVVTPAPPKPPSPPDGDEHIDMDPREPSGREGDFAS